MLQFFAGPVFALNQAGLRAMTLVFALLCLVLGATYFYRKYSLKKKESIKKYLGGILVVLAFFLTSSAALGWYGDSTAMEDALALFFYLMLYLAWPLAVGTLVLYGIRRYGLKKKDASWPYVVGVAVGALMFLVSRLMLT